METKNLYIAGLIAVFVMISLGYVWYEKPTPTPLKSVTLSGEGRVGTADDAEAYDVLITFDGEKYTPREVTIQKGQRVRFQNDSDTLTWPASAIHPTHSLYPSHEESDCLGSSFDACRGLEKGETWSYTFYELGEWRFHDHLNASKTGVVMVQE